MYEFFHCGARAVIWCADFMVEEYGYEDEDGLIHECQCTNCGAQITYYVPSRPEE